MKLEGSLDAFSLPDIFQLLSYTKKTGGLRLQHAGTHGVVYFVDGAVTGASAEGSRQVLARRLVGLGLVDESALSAAVESAVRAGSTTSGGGVVAALVSAGAVSADVVGPVAYEQVHDAVFDLLRWPAGDFQLAVDQLNPDDIGLRLAPDEVVARASEQRSRWGAASAVVPSPDAVPVLAGPADADTTVRATDWAVLRLVDGRRRVAEIVDLAGAGQVATVVTLADLVERGIVEIRASDAGDRVSDTVRSFAVLVPAEGAAPPTREPDQAAAVPAAPEPPLVSVFDAPDPVLVEPAAVPEAFAPASSTVVTVEDEPLSEAEPVLAGPTATQPRLGGAHEPGDVVPPRVEPFLASRTPEFAEASTPVLRSAPPIARSGPGGVGLGNTAVAVATVGDSLIERDPSVNRSLLLRLIAGVRGL